MTEMVEIFNIAAIRNSFKITNMLKCKIQNLSKETENVKKGQMENLEWKNTNNKKRKNSVDELNSIMDGDRRKINEVKNKQEKLSSPNKRENLSFKKKKKDCEKNLGTFKL